MKRRLAAFRRRWDWSYDLTGWAIGYQHGQDVAIIWVGPFEFEYLRRDR